MSRIGKKPVPLPSGVTATIDGQTVAVKGPKGTLSFRATDDVSIAQENGAIVVRPRGDSKRARQQWGMSRSMIENLVTGVTQGFRRELDITGVGYRAQMQGKTLKMALGYSHDVTYEPPPGITITTPSAKNDVIVVEGIDAQQVGQVAAEIRAWRGPEPYKGKGIRYRNEFIFRKEGKKK
ncbi:LSU ribosomal protein L6P [Rubellimicrobium thermophilum DSM 16684]|uniref:Large ribosomal subunit protein uL6 n=1 Tax=Rubellimicrobium thermophilum DSM 16684 TaxID=1123069 RepID=S9QS73_9RHOB|nr:50S ribosomal protein L6 [Rubellimicrobium thermophilum]EPX84241.1 LSU ribosomal protein L6P [Rubellimicrobium thermophilum DSM 16684]